MHYLKRQRQTVISVVAAKHLVSVLNPFVFKTITLHQNQKEAT